MFILQILGNGSLLCELPGSKLLFSQTGKCCPQMTAQSHTLSCSKLSMAPHCLQNKCQTLAWFSSLHRMTLLSCLPIGFAPPYSRTLYTHSTHTPSMPVSELAQSLCSCLLPVLKHYLLRKPSPVFPSGVSNPAHTFFHLVGFLPLLQTLISLKTKTMLGPRCVLD